MHSSFTWHCDWPDRLTNVTTYPLFQPVRYYDFQLCANVEHLADAKPFFTAAIVQSTLVLIGYNVWEVFVVWIFVSDIQKLLARILVIMASNKRPSKSVEKLVAVVVLALYVILSHDLSAWLNSSLLNYQQNDIAVIKTVHRNSSSAIILSASCDNLPSGNYYLLSFRPWLVIIKIIMIIFTNSFFIFCRSFWMGLLDIYSLLFVAHLRSRYVQKRRSTHPINSSLE